MAGGNRFSGRGAPALAGMPAPAVVVAPAVVPAGIGREARIPMTEEWDTQRRDLLGGKAIIRAQIQDGYWSKFADPGSSPFRYSFATDGSPVMPGAPQTVLVGVFEVPPAMTACLRHAKFGANKSVGGVEQPLAAGDLNRVLFFAMLDNGAQLATPAAFVATPPAGGFSFGTGTNLQRPVQAPGTVLCAGPGVATEEGDDMWFLAGGHQFAVVMTVLAALPFAITSASAVLSGRLIADRALMDRVNMDGRR